MYCGLRLWILCCCGGIFVTASASAQNVSSLPHQDLPFGKGGRCCSVVSGDFNGDGKLDLVLGNGQSGLSVLLGNGAGSFSAKSMVAIVPNANVISTSDLN